MCNIKFCVLVNVTGIRLNKLSVLFCSILIIFFLLIVVMSNSMCMVAYLHVAFVIILVQVEKKYPKIY